MKKIILAALLVSTLKPISAFWVVNFGSANTLAPGKIGFAAGMGGQVVRTGEPAQTNAFFLIPHAGFRFGLAERFDIGWRLAPIPLPYSTVGPGFGANIDVKWLVNAPDAAWRFALIAGLGGAHVLILDHARMAYSPNGAFLLSTSLSESTHLTFMGRYVYLAIPTAPGDAAQNFVHITGISVGLKYQLHPQVAILPEIGGYWYEGAVGGVKTSGPGGQYGIMLATSF